MTDNATNLPISKLRGVGPKTQDRLAKLGLLNIDALLFHLPFRYEDRTQITPIRKLQPGMHAAIVATVIETRVIAQKKSRCICWVTDPSGGLSIWFFYSPKFRLQFNLQPGQRIYGYGEIRWTKTGLTMIHPEYRLLNSDEPPPLTTTLTPIYPTTAGLSQKVLRGLIAQALTIAEAHPQTWELLPDELLANQQLPSLMAALKFIHHPLPSNASAELLHPNHPMRRRLIFEELLAEQLSLLQLRATIRCHQAPTILWHTSVFQQITSNLPFQLTSAQQRVLQEIATDLAANLPMLRLLQGDVGCGKTIVAAIAIAQAVQNGYQAALMAPTELLARQHYANLVNWLAPWGIRVTMFSGKITGKLRKSQEQELAQGDIQVAIGTHALFQERIQFAKLALVVVDEQHRFGVHQRLLLRDKGLQQQNHPHQLIMTATPIPRTLAMTIHADLDHSIIDELPNNRPTIHTLIIANSRRAEVIEYLRLNCQNAQQAYWVCPLIEESEHLQCQAATHWVAELKSLLPTLRIGLVHGRMSSEQKSVTMGDFLDHRLDLLVATTVIEVGVDVANASIMVIENPERLGLVQLHQLRGRVGRGTTTSYCMLLYQSPLTHTARQRLELLRKYSDGRILAQQDLQLRGIGEFLGTHQTGTPPKKIADLWRDQHLIPDIQKSALFLLNQHPQLVAKITSRWIGGKEQYGQIG